MDKKSIFLVDDDVAVLEMLARFLAGEGYHVKTENSGERALQILQEEIFDIVISDLLIDSINGIDVLKKTKQVSPRTEVIIITGHASVHTAVQAIKEGAFDYISKPLDLLEINIVLQKAKERQNLVAEVRNLRSQIKDYYRLENIISVSSAMQKVLEMVRRVAQTDATVLIEGESGTGKEVIARAIHNNGLRAKGHFVAVNCGAMPENLLESELFGHVRGAFTGANATKKGLFEEANGGTIFLDEVGETSLTFQVKLLRVLQENEIRRVGDTKPIPVDARVLAASNRPLRQMVEEGVFRKDLYYRLRVIPIYIPPLRERKEDIVPLAKYFFSERYCRRTGDRRVRLSREAVKKLESYSWPGNVREMENMIERAMLVVQGNELSPEDILLEPQNKNELGYDFASLSMQEVEKMHIKNMLEACFWNQTETARRLGIGYNTLWRKIKEYEIKKQS